MECEKKSKLFDVFRADCAIRKDYYVINYAIYAIFLLDYFKLVLLGF